MKDDRIITVARCENGCQVNEDETADDYNPLREDGYCQSCHDYPDG